MGEQLTLKEADELGDEFGVFEGPNALWNALAIQMTDGGTFYTQVDTEEGPIYVVGHELVNRTGVYAVRRREVT